MRKSILVFFILSISIGSTACANSGNSLDAWVSDKIDSDEKLLCKLKRDNDYFLVAQSNGKLKIAYMLDVTSSTREPQSFIISWMFQNEKDKHIGLSEPSEVISNGVISIGNRVYVEKLSYRPVYLTGSNRLKINIGLKKYMPGDNIPSANELNDDDLEYIKLCDTPVEEIIS